MRERALWRGLSGEATACYVVVEAFTNATEHTKACGAGTFIERADGALTLQIRLSDGAIRPGQ